MTSTIEELQKNIEEISKSPNQFPNEKIALYAEKMINFLDCGQIRVCEKKNDAWLVNEWVKQGILLYFRSQKMQLMHNAFDKIPLKTNGWDQTQYEQSNFRIVPGSIIRKGTYIAPSAVIMPSFVNIGAHIEEGTMIDSYATVGSCAQIGKSVHLSSNTVVGGVLEPLQAKPVIIENNAFIGAGSSVLEGVIVQEGAVIGAGLTLSASTKIVDRETGNISYSTIPPYSVVIPGNYKISETLTVSCAIITKQVDERTRKKTNINDLLRM